MKNHPQHISTQPSTSTSSTEPGSPVTTKIFPTYKLSQTIDFIPYIHGGYAASAPLFIGEEEWMLMLRKLMPEAYDKVERLILNRKQEPLVYMRWAENNPVVAAYGILAQLEMLKLARKSKNLEYGTTTKAIKALFYSDSNVFDEMNNQNGSHQTEISALEWDVFLDPYLVQRVDRALQKVQDLYNSVHSSGLAKVTAQNEVDRLVGQLIKRMLLAHGSASQLVTEALGVLPMFNFSRVENGVRENKVNGVFVERWLALFCTALKIGLKLIKLEDAADSKSYPVSPTAPAPKLCGVFLCFALNPNNDVNHNDTIIKSTKEIHSILGTNLRVVLDLKSRRVPARVWARLIDNLRTRGIEVEGLGSFNISELRGVNEFCSTPVTTIIFFHSAGDLQRACHTGEVRFGDTVYFNAASLLSERKPLFSMSDGACCSSKAQGALPRVKYFIQEYAKARDVKAMLQNGMSNGAYINKQSCIQDYSNYFNLKVGLYIQEFDVSVQALEVLVKHVNEHRSTFKLGFAWGGINGKSIKGLEGDGFWNQRYVGRDWNERVGPKDVLSLGMSDQKATRDLVLTESCANITTVID